MKRLILVLLTTPTLVNQRVEFLVFGGVGVRVGGRGDPWSRSGRGRGDPGSLTTLVNTLKVR